MSNCIVLRCTAFGCLLFVVALGCDNKAHEKEKPPPPTVQVTQPIEKDVNDYTFFTGRTDAVNSVDIRARVTGYLVRMPFKEGAEVKKGDLLFEIDPRPYQATLDSQEGQVKLAEARLKLAVADFSRAKEISKTPGAISQQDMDKYAATQSEADAAVTAAKANAENARLNLGFTKVTSPIDGQVGRYLLTLGNLVNQDMTLLTTVVSVDPMYAYFDVDERTMLRAKTLIGEGKMKSAREAGNLPVQMGLANEGELYPHEGFINFVNNQLDPTTGTIQLRATFPNALPAGGGLRSLAPGMFVRVRVPMGPARKSLILPQAAVGTDQGRKYLLVVDSNNVVEYRPVELGPPQPGGLQVIDPIKVIRTKDAVRVAAETEKGEPSIQKDDWVVVSGLQRIRPGMTVTPKKKGAE